VIDFPVKIKLLSTFHNYACVKTLVVIVVLADPFRGMKGWKNSTETQQSCHSPRSGSKVKNGRSGAIWRAERFGCGTIKREVSYILQIKKKSPFVLFCISMGDKRRLWPWQQRRDSSQWARRERGSCPSPRTIFAPLALWYNYYLNKIIAKMLHLSTETYNI